jgi:hypothetical protein
MFSYHIILEDSFVKIDKKENAPKVFFGTMQKSVSKVYYPIHDTGFPRK